MNSNLARIAALLRKAENTDNEYEAAAFMDKAQQLATMNSVDLAVARAHTAAQEARAEPIARKIEIGERGKKYLKTMVKLFLAIGHANGLVFDIAHNSTYVIVYGFETDIEAAEALYSSLAVQMVRASTAYLASGEYRAETVERWDARNREWSYQPISGITARNNFQLAFAERVGRRLAAARNAATQAATMAEVASPASTGVELALRVKEAEVTSFRQANTKARGAWKGARSSGSLSEVSRRAGDDAGGRARLGGEKAIGGVRVALSA